MAQLQVALDTARALLNDVGNTLWTNTALLPYAKQAQSDLSDRLALSGVPVTRDTSIVLSVPALTTLLSGVAGFPSDLVKPISLKERYPGQADQDYVDVDERDFPPLTQMTNRLEFWSWLDETLLVRGATTATEVLIRYTKDLTRVTAATDQIGFTKGENYLGYRIAALAAGSVGNTSVYEACAQEAEDKLDVVVRIAVKGQQNMPARRRGYNAKRRGFRRIFG